MTNEQKQAISSMREAGVATDGKLTFTLRNGMEIEV